MAEYDYTPGAPFNMAIATLMSLRKTLDDIRDVEKRIEFPPEERQRVKIELVKKFYIDSCPLLKDGYIEKFNYVLELKPEIFIITNKTSTQKKKRVRYSYELNLKLDTIQRDIQRALQKSGKYYMPPSDDMSSIVGKMS